MKTIATMDLTKYDTNKNMNNEIKCIDENFIVFTFCYYPVLTISIWSQRKNERCLSELHVYL